MKRNWNTCIAKEGFACDYLRLVGVDGNRWKNSSIQLPSIEQHHLGIICLFERLKVNEICFIANLSEGLFMCII